MTPPCRRGDEGAQRVRTSQDDPQDRIPQLNADEPRASGVRTPPGSPTALSPVRSDPVYASAGLRASIRRNIAAHDGGR